MIGTSIRRLRFLLLPILLGSLLPLQQADAVPDADSAGWSTEPVYAPWVHQAALTQSNTPGTLGNVLAVSEDGNTIVAGVPDAFLNDQDVGLVRVYVKPEEGGWEDAQETATLTASDGNAIDHFGISVANQ